jgi:predicted O-methyltransferase YrrM
MPRRTLILDDTLYEYLIAHTAPEHPAQIALREATRTWPREAMQISPDQAQFLAFLLRLIDARRAIEIGVFTGYSALTAALALPADGYLLACDITDDDVKLGQPYWEAAGISRKIDLVLAPALETLSARLDSGEAETYDFAFIDADKTSYDSYYELCLKLLRPGGLIAIDNVLWSGSVAKPSSGDLDTEALKILNSKIRNDARVNISMLSIGDGLTLVRKK